ncbi:oxidoreductase [Aspergillus pseudoustus]|uniref:Oxidoreductase n=1 Tax=Aspergillus pseudoustus TaxID=1810923 RepID=A0ABR4IG92_9EURO
MPTAEYFAKSPPFPSGIELIDLPQISLASLRKNTASEAERLYKASREWGFFLLRLDTGAKASDGGDSALLKDAETMFELAEELFSLDQETLDKFAYDAPRDITGYKAMGKLKTDDGKTDHMHLYSINQDDMLGNRPRRTNAPPLEAHRTEIQSFIQNAHAALRTIFDILDTHLGLTRGTLSALCPLDQQSETSVRLLSSPAQYSPEPDRISLGGHTDIGAITLLFNVVGGLQILPAGRENVAANWRYIKPEPGCAVVNIGDTLVEWTGGLLRSSLHRVVTAPGEQGGVTRRSVAYLVRPANSGSMRRLKGGRIPPVGDGDEEETRSVNEWAAWRSRQVMLGQLKPQTRGGADL